MTRPVKLAAAGLALLLAARAGAQTENAVDRERGLPMGLTIPGVTVAGAEEPSAVNLNPAGVGLVGDLTLQYFHEGGRAGRDFAGDGFYLADRWGGMNPSLAIEWVRPNPQEGPRYRKSTFGLAFGGRAGSLGFGYARWSSPDDSLDDLSAWDFGLTLRPTRHLSLAAAAQNVGAPRLDGEEVPVRYNFGTAFRFWRDSLTLSGDLFAHSGGTNSFLVTHGAVGLGAELRSGLGFQLQVSVPFGGDPGFESARRTLFAITYNREFIGVTGGAGNTNGDGTLAASTWLAGVRVSRERYRAAASSRSIPVLDLRDALDAPTSVLFGVTRRDPFGDLLKKLEDLRGDRGAGAVVLRIRDLPIGPGQTEELRNAILKVKERKPVVAYLLDGRTSEYWLASAATRVYTAPMGEVALNGLAISVPFLRQGLERIGVAFDVVAQGPYKNAPDPLVRKDMSEAQREATGALLDDLYARQVRDIASARQLPEDRVRALVDEGLFGAEAAQAAGLTDGALWPDQVEQALEKLLGRKVELGRGYERAPERMAQRWGPRGKIAVVGVEGVIAAGRSRPGALVRDGIAGSDTLAQLLREAAGDASVRAIVLRIDSPGGDGLASDLVWREVTRAREKGKVVIASMGDTAASGGYLVAVAAEQIVAEPSTLTGSIGVFAVKPDFSALLAKVGVNTVTLKRGENATLFSVSKPWTDSERKLVERETAVFYDGFLSRVAAGRNLPKEEVERVAGGRVWTGAQAMERKLVDRLGGLDAAVALARERAGIAPGEEVDVERFDPDLPLLAGLGDSGLSIFTGARPSPLARIGELLPEVRTAALLLEMGTVVALPPEWVLGGTVQ